jgi:hypothetical protein
MSVDVYGYFAAYLQDNLGLNVWVAEEVETETPPYLVVEDRGFSTDWYEEGAFVDSGSIAVHCFAESGDAAREIGSKVKRLFGTVDENDDTKIPVPPNENFRFVNVQRTGYSLHIEPDPNIEGNRVYRYQVDFNVVIQGVHTLPLEVNNPTINHLQLRDVDSTNFTSVSSIMVGVDGEADQYNVRFYDVPNSTWSATTELPGGTYLTLTDAIYNPYNQATYPYLRVGVQAVIGGVVSGWSEANMTLELRRPNLAYDYANGTVTPSIAGFSGNFAFRANDTIPRIFNPEDFSLYTGQNLAGIPNSGRFVFGARSFSGFGDVTVGMSAAMLVQGPEEVTTGSATGPDADNIVATWTATSRAVWYDIYVDDVLVDSDIMSPYAMPPGQVNGATVNIHARNAFGDTAGSNFTLSY